MLLPPQGEDSTLFSCSRVGSIPWETVLHKLLQHEFFPQAAVLHKLLQHRSFPWDAVLQEQIVLVWVHHRVTSPASTPSPVWVTLSMQLHRSCQKPAPAWASHRATAFFGHQLQQGALHRLQIHICSVINLIFNMCWRGVSAQMPGVLSPPPSSLTVVSAELFHIVISSAAFFAEFPPLFKCYPRGTAPIADELDLGQLQGCLGAGRH